MKTATYIGGEFDALLPESHAVILGEGQPLQLKNDKGEVVKEIEKTFNCLVYDSQGQQLHKFNVVAEADKIRSKNEKEETYHPYLKFDSSDNSALTQTIAAVQKQVEEHHEAIADLVSKNTPTT